MSTPSKSSHGLVKVTLLTALIAGTLDITAAIVMYTSATGKSGFDVLYYVASGAFGSSAFAGGKSMVFAGLFFHYIIAYSFTSFYFLIYKNIKKISANWMINAVVYGLFVWVIMNLIVLPLTNVPPVTFDVIKVIRGMVVLIFAIGAPISYSAKRHYSK